MKKQKKQEKAEFPEKGHKYKKEASEGAKKVEETSDEPEWKARFWKRFATVFDGL
jgi:hypothetical protein